MNEESSASRGVRLEEQFIAFLHFNKLKVFLGTNQVNGLTIQWEVFSTGEAHRHRRFCKLLAAALPMRCHEWIFMDFDSVRSYVEFVIRVNIRIQFVHVRDHVIWYGSATQKCCGRRYRNWALAKRTTATATQEINTFTVALCILIEPRENVPFP